MSFSSSAARSRSVLLRAALAGLVVSAAGPLTGAQAAVAPATAGGADASPVPAAAPKGGVEVPSLESAKTRVWKRANGSYVSRLYQQPVNEKTAAGVWAPIDDSLTKTSSGTIQSGDGAADLQLPSSLASGPVKLSDGSDSLSLSLQDAGSGAAQLAGNTATYPAVADGVTAKLASTNTGVKEDLILASAEAQNTFTYTAKLSSGLSLKPRKDGGVDVENSAGDVVFAIAAPLAIDAKGAVAPGAQSTLAVDGDQITVSLDHAWLAATDRSFPVSLDPSAVLPSAHDCYLDGANQTTSYCTSADLWVGTSGGHDHRSVLNFNVSGQIPVAANITEATLNLYPQYQTNPGVTKTFADHALSTSFDDNATWTKATASTSWTTAGGDFNPADLDTNGLPGTGTWQEYVATDTVSGWLADPTTNHGLILTDDGSTANNSVVYQSFDSPSSNDPYLQIDWFPRTGQTGDATILTQSISGSSSLGVNVAGGNLILSSSDLHVGSTGLPVSIQRFYNSQDPWTGTLGSKGRIGIGNDVALYQASDRGDYILITGDGARYRFIPKNDGSGTYTTPNGAGNVTLKDEASGRHSLTDNGSGVIYGFYAGGYAYMDTYKDQYGNALTLEYHGTNNTLSKITDVRGRAYAVASNSDGFITSITAPATSSTAAQTWTYHFNSGDDLLTWVKDPLGNQTTYAYSTDGYDLLTKITDARGNDTTIAYDASQRVTSILRKVDTNTAHDVKTVYEYATSGFDSFCPTTITTSSAGVKSGGVTTGETTVYPPNYQTSPTVFKPTKYCTNQAGQVIYAVDGNGKPTSNFYNPQGNSSNFAGYAGTSGAGTSQVSYDGLGQNPVSATTPTGATSSATYPAATTPGITNLQLSRPDTTTNPQGKTTSYTYNTQGSMLTAKTGTHNLQATLTYNPAGNAKAGTIATATDGNSNTTTYGYDSLGELTTVVPQPLVPPGSTTPAPGTQMGTTTYTYDGLSRVKTISNGISGNLQTLSYDADNRVTSIADSDGKTLSLTFDANGNVTQRTEGSNTTSYVFDALNRKTSETFPSSAVDTYTYDQNSNLATLTDPNGTTSYTYEAANRTASISSPPATGTTQDVTSIAWKDPSTPGYTDATHTLEIETMAAGGGTIKQTEDLDGKLSDVIVNTPGGAQTLHRTYTYAIGSTNHEVLDNQVDFGTGSTPVTTTTYGYGDNDMLTGASTVNGAAGSNVRTDTLTYDGAGNRTTRTTQTGAGAAVGTTYAYNKDNQLCWQANATTATACSATAPSGGTAYTYDAAGNQLTGGQTTTWDAKNRLKTLNSNAVTTLSPTNSEITGIGTTGYHNTVLGTTRINANGTIYALVRDPGSGGVVSQVAGGVKRWLVTDQLGSTIALVDSGGAVQKAYAYDIDGNATASTPGSGPGTPVTYAGGIDVGGVMHYGERYYSPNEARWTQADSFDSPGDLSNANRYLYVGSDPINAADPSGLCIVVSCKTWSAAGHVAWAAAKGCATGALISANVGGCLVGGAEEGALKAGVEADKAIYGDKYKDDETASEVVGGALTTREILK